jgi:hypothetical protein
VICSGLPVDLEAAQIFFCKSNQGIRLRELSMFLCSIPFVDPKLGIIIFAAASILKDTTNRIGDIVDDGKPNQSFKG